MPVQNARPHSGSYSLSSWGGPPSAHPEGAGEHGHPLGELGGQRGDHPVPVADRPLVAEVLGHDGEDRADRLADALADRGAHFGREERRVLVVRADDLAGLGVGREPRGGHPAGREAGDDRRASDDAVDEPDQVVADEVERVAARGSRRSSLTAEVDGEGLEVVGQQAERLLVAPPRLGLPGDQQERGSRCVTRRWRS